MKEYFKKHREIITYLLFGVVVTLASKGTYFAVLAIGEHLFEMSRFDPSFDLVRTIAKIGDWIVGVSVAFITNKLWVFESSSNTFRGTMSELGKFAGSRVGTGLLDLALSIAIVRVMVALSYKPFTFIFEFTPDLWAQIITSIVIIISNYLISKFWVFKKK